jgi:hypothetical protein
MFVQPLYSLDSSVSDKLDPGGQTDSASEGKLSLTAMMSLELVLLQHGLEGN